MRTSGHVISYARWLRRCLDNYRQGPVLPQSCRASPFAARTDDSHFLYLCKTRSDGSAYMFGNWPGASRGPMTPAAESFVSWPGIQQRRSLPGWSSCGGCEGAGTLASHRIEAHQRWATSTTSRLLLPGPARVNTRRAGGRAHRSPRCCNPRSCRPHDLAERPVRPHVGQLVELAGT